MLTKEGLTLIWKTSKLAPKVFARLMGLKHKSSLYAYMSGDKPISKRFAQRVEDWQRGGHRSEIISKFEIPAGTVLPDNAELFECIGCHCKSIRVGHRRQYHTTYCQQKTWRSANRRRPHD